MQFWKTKDAVTLVTKVHQSQLSPTISKYINTSTLNLFKALMFVVVKS